MTDIYREKIKLRQVPFVVAWFAILMAIYILIPSHFNFIKAVLIACWWYILVIGIRASSKKQYLSIEPSAPQLYNASFNPELYEKAIEHNREGQNLIIKLWLVGFFIVVIGFYLKISHHLIAGLLITIGLFLTSFLSTRPIPSIVPSPNFPELMFV